MKSKILENINLRQDKQEILTKRPVYIITAQTVEKRTIKMNPITLQINPTDSALIGLMVGDVENYETYKIILHIFGVSLLSKTPTALK